MSMRSQEWKREVERLWSAASLDYAQATRLVAEIAQQGERAFLQETAAQALPSLRRATLKNADRMAKSLARRRFGSVRDALHAMTAPRFGRRRGDDEPSDPDEEHRRMLGLPLGRRLYGPEISQAYKRAAKTAHPDAGGTEKQFRELSAARDALMKRG